MKINKIKIFLVLIFQIVFVGTLFSIDLKLLNNKKNEITIQELYNNISEATPALIYLGAQVTSGVSFETTNIVEQEIQNQMILMELFKPVSMKKHLDSKYGNKKFNSFFNFFDTLSTERYSINVQGFFKTKIYKIGTETVVKITIYPFHLRGFPITSIRIIKNENEIQKAIQHSLQDLKILYDNYTLKKLKIIVTPFEIDCKTLIEQKTGEFDFISTSFSNQNGVELKNTDDFFSEIFAYQTQCSDLFSVATINCVSDYVEMPKNINQLYSHKADFLVKGKVLLSNKYNIVTIDFYDNSNGKQIFTKKYISKTLNLKELWNSNYEIISEFCKKVINSNEIRILENISNNGKYFYINNMFCGFDEIKNFPIKIGKTVIHTGNNISSDFSLNPNYLYEKNNNDFFIYTNNDEIQIYKGREGAYLWNLLAK